MLTDLRYAFRLLARNPGFTAAAVLTLALGIGTNTAIFSLADGMLFRPLPFHDPDRLVLIQGFDRRSGQAYSRVWRVDFEQIRQHHSGIEGIAVVAQGPRLTWIGRDGAEAIAAAEASPNFMSVLGAGAHLGRPLQPGDEAALPRPAMLLHGPWQRRFGGDPTIVGRIVEFDQGSVRIVGIVPPRFIYPVPVSFVRGELLLAAPPDPNEAADPRAGVWTPIARLKRGVSIAQAQGELDVLVQRAAQQFPETFDRALRVSNLQSALFELSRPLLLLLLGAAGFVLLIACANLASLLLARGTGREREIGIRQAIGAGRGRLVRQLLVESTVLALLGGVAALALGALTFDVLAQWAPSRFQLVPEGLDARAAVFSVAAAVLAGVVFGMLPALRLSAPDIQLSLKDGIRSRAAAGIFRAGAPLVAAEVALGLVLLAGTGLMINTLVRMRTVDLGFDPAGIVTMSFGLPDARYPTAQHRYDHYQRFLDILETLPAVESAAAIDSPQTPRYAPPGLVHDKSLQVIGVWGVTPGYFATIGLPLVAGRDVTDGEARADAPVALVNESAARLLWPNQSALGQRLLPDRSPALTVIGVVKDVRQGYGEEVTLSVYRPLSRNRFRWMTIVARANGDPAVLATAMRAEAQRMDPALVVPRPEPLVDVLDRHVADTTFQTSLFILFGALGVLVAAVGIYGLVGYWVGMRSHEMGVRVALGARPDQLVSLVLRQAAVPLAAGIVLGLIGAFVLAHRVEGLLYGVTPHDPATHAVVCAVLLGVGLLAAYLPARRAARVDPMIVLRGE